MSDEIESYEELAEQEKEIEKLRKLGKLVRKKKPAQEEKLSYIG